MSLRKWGAGIGLFAGLVLLGACSDSAGAGGGGQVGTGDSESADLPGLPGEDGTGGSADSGTADGLPLDDSTGGTPDGTSPGDAADDSVSPEETASPCPSGPGCSCTGNADCLSGFCIDTQKGAVCAETCTSGCPDGFACKPVQGSGGDLVSICVPSFPNLCQPCKADGDCKALGAEALCVSYKQAGGDDPGSYCGGSCGDTSPCPDGFECADVPTASGQTAKQCRKKDLQCTCSDGAVKLKLATTCSVTNAIGTCQGQRVCGDTGLTACDAPAAVSETCNGTDDDCDGKTDEDTCDDKNPCTNDKCDGKGCVQAALVGPCDDGNLCTVSDTCKDGACKGQDKSCDDGNPCTDDTCDPGKGCGYAFASGPCSTGNLCEIGATCLDGVCQGGKKKDCDDGNACTVDVCDIKTGNCTQKNVEAVPCDDNNPCTTADTCADGFCLGKAKSCDDKNPCTEDSCDAKVGCKATPTTDACDDGNACTEGEKCDAGACKGAPVDCDDKNVCTNDSCDPTLSGGKSGAGCQHGNLNTPCNDGNACTQTDFCLAGVCSGKAVECNDNNPCTDDACDLATGCTSTANTVGCEDGNACTAQDVCQSGVCKGTALSCDDKNPCTNDSCDVKLGCQQVQVTTPCDDANACTQGDQCAGGVCTGKAVSCDDKNPCTDDACDPGGGCKSTANQAECDDGSACTTTDLCKDGKCEGQGGLQCDDGNPCTTDTCSPGKGCQVANNTASCDDGNPCTEGDQCGGGACLAGKAIVCDDKNACTDDSCNAKTGSCEFAANTKTCSDGDLCTTGDLCGAGQCAGKAVGCDDGNACTDDTCDKQTGKCVQAASTDPCDDNSACTQNDTCLAGACKGTTISCDDKNPCTTDSCDAKFGCMYKDNTLACNDGDACTKTDTCKEGQCVGAVVSCGDGNPCTDDKCDKATGCANDPNTAPCSDGSACTSGDVCKGGSCVGAVIACNDNNPCTDDSCDKASGCVAKANTLACSDGSACTQGDVCTASKCVGAAVKCDDANPCTTDTCDPTKGCVFTNNTLDCSDGSACTSGDKCSAGKCLGTAVTCGDNNGCTNDKCDPASGCVFTNNTLFCSDGNSCTKTDQCSGGKCVPGAAPNCDDLNPCTDDSCDPAKGCVHVNNTKVCDDKNNCTQSDVCSAGVCKGSGGPDCNDNNPCTDDPCSASTGCTHVNNTATCSDGSECTVGDKCATGKCVAGPALVCDDKNVCTDDKCDPLKGCTTVANTAPCNDNDACTVGDLCKASACVPGAPANCDDKNPCTTDSCDAIKGCVHVNNTAGCNDSNSCTQVDTCSGGVCVGASPPNCDDGNPCTTDACDKALGCTHAANTSPCNDNNACTSNDACAATKCVGGPAVVCNDNNVCTSDSCDPAKGCVSVNNTATCNDNNACTSGEKCASGTCGGGAAKVCDDANPCTADSCDAATGSCVFKLGTTCTVKALPYSDPVDCGDKDWALSAAVSSVGWGVDATPGTPGKLSGSCSLNYNNGTNYAGSTSGSATSAVMFDATGLAKVTLAFLSYNGTDPGETAGTNFDKRIIEASVDGFVTIAVSKVLSTEVDRGKWVYEAVDLSLLAGKKFQVRFRFDSVDSAFNAGTGWFVEEINLYGGPIWTPKAGANVTEPFAAGNASGWQFSAAIGGVGWAIDATAADPGKLDGDASLNFNDGTDFAASTGGTVTGWALSPLVDLTGLTAGTKATLLYRSWFQSESSQSYDKRLVEVSDNNFVTTLASVQLDNTKAQAGWTFQSLDLSPYVGKKVRLRFRFDSVDGAANSYKGWFVDALQVQVQPAPVFQDGIVCSLKTNWTLANAQATTLWAIDATPNPPAPASADCTLNFNNGTSFTCPSGSAKVSGTATSVTFATTAPPAGQKLWLRFKAYQGTESSGSFDVLKAEISDHGYGTAANQIVVVPKTSLGTWTDQAIDISALAGKTLQVRFSFDSVDCAINDGKGVFVDDVIVQAGP